jgi:CheY-like chemotaxis protein
MSILLVDPNVGFRERFVNLLLVTGFNNIETSGSLQEAFQMLSKSCFKVALVDLFMPDMDGLHFAQRSQNEQPTLKIYLLIEDKWQKVLNGGEKISFEFPIILKSFIDSQFLKPILKYCR